MPKHYVTQLAASLRNGQGAQRLYDAYGLRLYGYCWSTLGGAAPAADTLLDTILVATAHGAALHDPVDMTAWVFALARNECLRRGPAAGGSAVREPADGPIEMLVVRALRDMQPTDRDVIELSVRYRFDGPQLGRVLGIDAEQADRFAQAARTRLEQTLTTLFMGSSGRIAVPEELIRDRPSLPVLLDLLRPPTPPDALRGDVVAACVDPELDQHRAQVARRALPLDDDGFPHQLDATPAAPSPVPDGGLNVTPVRHSAIGATFSPPDTAGERGPMLAPVAGDLIPAEAIMRARAEEPIDEADPDGADASGADASGADASGAQSDGVDTAEAGPLPKRGARRVRNWRLPVAGAALSVLAVAGAVWAGQQLTGGSSGPHAAPSVSSGSNGGAPVPTDSRTPLPTGSPTGHRPGIRTHPAGGQDRAGATESTQVPSTTDTTAPSAAASSGGGGDPTTVPEHRWPADTSPGPVSPGPTGPGQDPPSRTPTGGATPTDSATPTASPTDHRPTETTPPGDPTHTETGSGS